MTILVRTVLKSMTIMDMSVNDTCSRKRHTETNLARKLGHFAIDILYITLMFTFEFKQWIFLKHEHFGKQNTSYPLRAPGSCYQVIVLI